MKSILFFPVPATTTSTLVLAICIALSADALAEDAQTSNAEVAYPFDLPDEITATLNVDTSRTTPVNHLLLGLNCNWPEGLYGKVGYNHPDAQKLIRKLKPTCLRFPHGVWANFYDRESDGRRITDDYKTAYDSAVKDHRDLKYGFDGFHKLDQELGFDVLLTFNVNDDSPEKAARRLIDRRDKGFDVNWVELGNEIFWKTQRSEAVIDVEKYIEVAKVHASALKAVAPEVLISIPAHWRTAETNPWNLAVKQHRYYDAVTLHKHMGNDSDREGAAATLDARRLMVQTGRTLRKVFPDLPIWVSEWSVRCGKEENAEIYDSSIESTTIGDGLDAVSAEAVVKDGKVTVFAINKTTRSVPFHVTFTGTPQARPLVHQTLSSTDLNQTRSFELDENLLSEVASGDESFKGKLVLPPLSLNRFDDGSSR
jgi:alpha-L-arabinofuranosidase